MIDYDVIICGAGPSGTTAAKFISEKGFRVALLDKSIFPREKLCGGALRLSIDKFDYVMSALKSISLINSYEVKMHSSSLKYTIDFKSKSPLIYHIKRLEFDALLLNIAVDSGANFFENSYVKKVAIDKEKSTVWLKNGEQLSSQIIIGAGGTFDPVSTYLCKKYNLKSLWQKSDMAYMMMQECLTDESFIADTFGDQYTSHFYLKPDNIYGYGWVFPKDNVLNVGLGGLWSDIKKIDRNAAINSFIKHLKKQNMLPKNFDLKHVKKTILPLSGPIKKTYDDRSILVGDAAGFISPLTGDGLYYAISSGKYAAETIIKALEAESYSSKFLKKYELCWQNEWGSELALLKFFTRNFHNQTERLMKYTSLDEKLRTNLQDIYTGRKDASKLILEIMPRILLDFFRFQI